MGKNDTMMCTIALDLRNAWWLKLEQWSEWFPEFERCTIKISPNTKNSVITYLFRKFMPSIELYTNLNSFKV